MRYPLASANSLVTRPRLSYAQLLVTAGLELVPLVDLTTLSLRPIWSYVVCSNVPPGVLEYATRPVESRYALAGVEAKAAQSATVSTVMYARPSDESTPYASRVARK